MVAEDTPSHYALPHWCNVKVKGFMTPACRYRLPIKLVKVLQDRGACHCKMVGPFYWQLK